MNVSPNQDDECDAEREVWNGQVLPPKARSDAALVRSALCLNAAFQADGTVCSLLSHLSLIANGRTLSSNPSCSPLFVVRALCMLPETTTIDSVVLSQKQEQKNRDDSRVKLSHGRLCASGGG